jgi:hypothetical protein
MTSYELTVEVVDIKKRFELTKALFFHLKSI